MCLTLSELFDCISFNLNKYKIDFSSIGRCGSRERDTTVEWADGVVKLLLNGRCIHIHIPAVHTKGTQNICITFIQCCTNVEDVGPTLYKSYTNVCVYWVGSWQNDKVNLSKQNSTVTVRSILFAPSLNLVYDNGNTFVYKAIFLIGWSDKVTNWHLSDRRY